MKELFEMFHTAEYLPDFKDFTLKDFCEANIIVLSRGFARFKEGLTYMVPFADMVNHSKNPEVKYYYDYAKRGFVLEAIKDIQKGDEITMCYKPNISNYECFKLYNFV